MNEKEKKLLNVGDVIYGNSIYRQSKHVIERVTRTQAISGNKKFRREYFDDCWITTIGSNRGFGSSSYILETPELKQGFEKSKIVNLLQNFKFDKLSFEVLNKIYQLIKESGVEK